MTTAASSTKSRCAALYLANRLLGLQSAETRCQQLTSNLTDRDGEVQKQTRTVQLMTSRSEQLQTNNQQLTNENERLLDEKQQLAGSIEQVLGEKRQLASRNEQLLSENHKMTTGRVQLLKENRRLNSENEQLLFENQQLVSSNQSKELKIERLNTRIQDKIAQILQLDKQLLSKGISWAVEKDRLSSQVNRLLSCTSIMAEEYDVLTRELQQHRSSNNDLAADNAQLTSKLQQQRSSNSDLAADNERLKSALLQQRSSTNSSSYSTAVDGQLSSEAGQQRSSSISYDLAAGHARFGGEVQQVSHGCLGKSVPVGQLTHQVDQLTGSSRQQVEKDDDLGSRPEASAQQVQQLPCDAAQLVVQNQLLTQEVQQARRDAQMKHAQTRLVLERQAALAARVRQLDGSVDGKKQEIKQLQQNMKVRCFNHSLHDA
jgi:chromosome segregation ATPase